MTIAVDLGRKATKQNTIKYRLSKWAQKNPELTMSYAFSQIEQAPMINTCTVKPPKFDI